MTGKTCKKMPILKFSFIGILLMLIIPLGSIPLTYADQEINVNCYIDSDGSYDNVGNVNVFNPVGAAAVCNKVYVKCEGKCIGCYIDQESGELCYDSGGQLFER